MVPLHAGPMIATEREHISREGCESYECRRIEEAVEENKKNRICCG